MRVVDSISASRSLHAILRSSVSCAISIDKRNEPLHRGYRGGVVLREVQAHTAVAERAELGAGRYDDACLQPEDPHKILAADGKGGSCGKI